MNERAAHNAAFLEGLEVNAPPHILIVDENPGICELLCQAFMLNGSPATACAGGDAWIDRAIQSDLPPTLILLNLNIPPMNATAFLHSLRTRWKAIPPILVMTTSKEVYDALAPVERVIRKPFHLHDLFLEVQRMLLAITKKMLAGQGV